MAFVYVLSKGSESVVERNMFSVSQKAFKSAIVKLRVCVVGVSEPLFGFIDNPLRERKGPVFQNPACTLNCECENGMFFAVHNSFRDFRNSALLRNSLIKRYNGELTL